MGFILVVCELSLGLMMVMNLKYLLYITSTLVKIVNNAYVLTFLWWILRVVKFKPQKWFKLEAIVFLQLQDMFKYPQLFGLLKFFCITTEPPLAHIKHFPMVSCLQFSLRHCFLQRRKLYFHMSALMQMPRLHSKLVPPTISLLCMIWTHLNGTLQNSLAKKTNKSLVCVMVVMSPTSLQGLRNERHL